ncbi:MurR/RpiR family transcriptional regulator [Neobacillus drentensis]|uniref:MurR/RpiR family transcriptional regulator n=1 Tax=Neobacillus drentensis TaxID=220684 RepID=UPI0030016E48
MNTFLKRLSHYREQLSQLERQVLDYILENPESVAKLNLNELSREIFVSTATISRTCKQIGYQGFQDLKYSLNKYVKSSDEDHRIPSLNELTSHIDRVKQEMELTLQYVNEEDIKQAANYIRESNFVEFFGVGASLPTCVDAARKLMFSGRVCSAREDWDALYSVARCLTEKDLAILVSYSGETSRILEFASILKEKKVKTIAIVGRKNSSLKQEVDLTFQGHVVDCYYGDIDMSSRFPLSVLLDFIILTYLNGRN